MIERTYIDEKYEPSLEDLKRHLRITSGDLDEILKTYLLSAINAAEHHIGKIIARSEFRWSGEFIGSFDLKGPGISMVSVTVDGEALNASRFSVKGRTLLFDQTVTGDKMEVSYTSGMKQVPFDIKAAIMLYAARLFNNPVDSVESLPSVSKNLLRPYRTWGLDDGE